MSLLTNTKSFRNSWEIPHGLDSKFSDCQLSRFIQTDLSIRLEASRANAVFQLRELHVGSRYCDRRADLYIFLLDYVPVKPWAQVTKRVHCNDLFGISPGVERSHRRSWLRVRKVWLVLKSQILARYGQSIIGRIRAAVGTNRCEEISASTWECVASDCGSSRSSGLAQVSGTQDRSRC